MTCQELADFLMQYLDDGLAREQRSEFESHVGICPDCLHYLETYRETVRLGRSICAEPEGPVPEDVPEDLVRAVLAARRD